jgi:hypothetical protein
VSQRFVTVVTGIPRSGTSLVMQMLAAGGVPPLCDAARTADADNPRGYYELAAVKRLARDGAPWLGEAAGRAVKVIHVLVPHLPPEADYRVVWIRRAMAAVLDSQRAMLARAGADADTLAEDRVAAVYAAQERALEAWLETHARGHWLRLDYDSVVADPTTAAHAIDVLLGGGLDRAAMAGAVEPPPRP